MVWINSFQLPFWPMLHWTLENPHLLIICWNECVTSSVNRYKLKLASNNINIIATLSVKCLSWWYSYKLHTTRTQSKRCNNKLSLQRPLCSKETLEWKKEREAQKSWFTRATIWDTSGGSMPKNRATILFLLHLFFAQLKNNVLLLSDQRAGFGWNPRFVS